MSQNDIPSGNLTWLAGKSKFLTGKSWEVIYSYKWVWNKCGAGRNWYSMATSSLSKKRPVWLHVWDCTEIYSKILYQWVWVRKMMSLTLDNDGHISKCLKFQMFALRRMTHIIGGAFCSMIHIHWAYQLAESTQDQLSQAATFSTKIGNALARWRYLSWQNHAGTDFTPQLLELCDCPAHPSSEN